MSEVKNTLIFNETTLDNLDLLINSNHLNIRK